MRAFIAALLYTPVLVHRHQIGHRRMESMSFFVLRDPLRGVADCPYTIRKGRCMKLHVIRVGDTFVHGQSVSKRGSRIRHAWLAPSPARNACSTNALGNQRREQLRPFVIIDNPRFHFNATA